VKPVALLSDAIVDCTARHDIVLDAFVGSGSTVLAAERTGRWCYGMEIDPSYVDTAIRRWQNHTRDRTSHAVTVAFLMKSKQKGNSMMATDDYDKEATSKPHGYEIGFAKPPSAPRFPKSQSGNPAGRPRGSKNLSTILEQELQERVVIRENGKQRTVTKRRASMKQFVNKALAGDPRILPLFINYLRDLEVKAKDRMPHGLPHGYNEGEMQEMVA